MFINVHQCSPVGNDVINILTTSSGCRDHDVKILLDPIKERILMVKLQFESRIQTEKLYYFCIPFSKPHIF